MKFLALLPLLSAFAVAAPNTLAARTVPDKLSIEKFTRNCALTEICEYSFIINYYPYGSQACTIRDTNAAKDGGAAKHSWYAVGCYENPTTWQVSWGWNLDLDFTVATIVNVPNNYRAFFGYSHPNVNLPVATYPDQVEPVQHG